MNCSQVLALAAHGCRHIQLDEPVMMRCRILGPLIEKYLVLTENTRENLVLKENPLLRQVPRGRPGVWCEERRPCLCRLPWLCGEDGELFCLSNDVFIFLWLLNMWPCNWIQSSLGFLILELFHWFHWWHVYCLQWLLWKAHNRLTFVADILTDWNPQTTRRPTARGFLQLLSRVIKSFFKWLCTSLRYPEVLCALDAAGFHWVELKNKFYMIIIHCVKLGSLFLKEVWTFDNHPRRP